MQIKREQWGSHVKARQTSGCSESQWGREQGSAFVSFGGWQRKLRDEMAPARLLIRPVSLAPAIEIRWASGIGLTVLGGDPD